MNIKTATSEQLQNELYCLQETMEEMHGELALAKKCLADCTSAGEKSFFENAVRLVENDISNCCVAMSQIGEELKLRGVV